jgi:hypothetical protein
MQAGRFWSAGGQGAGLPGTLPEATGEPLSCLFWCVYVFLHDLSIDVSPPLTMIDRINRCVGSIHLGNCQNANPTETDGRDKQTRRTADGR